MIRRVWPVIIKARIDFGGGRTSDVWVHVYPSINGFITVVQLEAGWRVYFIDSMKEVPDAVRQAIIDNRILSSGRPGSTNFTVSVVDVTNTWYEHRVEVSSGLEHELPPLGDIYTLSQP